MLKRIKSRPGPSASARLHVMSYSDVTYFRRKQIKQPQIQSCSSEITKHYLHTHNIAILTYSYTNKPIISNISTCPPPTKTSPVSSPAMLNTPKALLRYISFLLNPFIDTLYLQ